MSAFKNKTLLITGGTGSFGSAVLNRFLKTDIDEYKLGFAFDNVYEYMPGHKIVNIEEFKEFIEDISNENDKYKEERQKINKISNDYCDGNNTKRLIEMFNL